MVRVGEAPRGRRGGGPTTGETFSDVVLDPGGSYSTPIYGGQGAGDGEADAVVRMHAHAWVFLPVPVNLT